MNANDSRYVSSMGYCHLYLTVEPITRADHSKAHVPEHTSIPEATTPFRSSSGSNQLSEPMPAMMTQFQYTNHMVPPVLHPFCSASQQNKDLLVNEHYVPRAEDDATTIDGGDSPVHYPEQQTYDCHGNDRNFNGIDSHHQHERINVPEDEENVPLEEVRANPACRSTSIGCPSSSNQYIRSLPPFPPSTTMASDAFSTSGLGEVSVGQIFSTKQELRCKWRIRATKTNSDTFFRVTRMESTHTCQNEQLRDGHRQASSRLIGQLIKDKFKDVSRIYTPKNIRDDIQNDYGVRLPYTKTWRSKEEALKIVCGDPAESFKGLPLYCHVLEDKNPGTVTAIETDDNGHFLYFFMALGQCIRGFRNTIRPVIAIDGTFLKGKFRGTLFVAVAQDGNNQIYPVAYGIADSENDALWEWFMEKLRSVIAPIENLVFISDRHNSIVKAINTVFPDATHGFCTYHISGNLKAKYKMRQQKIDTFMAAYFKAADAYRQSEFNKYMDSLRAMNPEAAKYLEDDIGLYRWARPLFPSRRYDMQTTNVAESMNSLLRHARNHPITPLVEFIRSLLQRWFYERRELHAGRDVYLTEAAQVKVDEQLELSRTMTVHPVSRFEFEVKERGWPYSGLSLIDSPILWGNRVVNKPTGARYALHL
ncbi:MuDR family transposase [Melia azedarach]|uniref:MuDR family transposase n=1 Tax=Melia azedarach TaxID=155640 RepID=A0ACC1WRI4_MELAZ|nr:MuDR family transposase [Melia azedarach]